MGRFATVRTAILTWTMWWIAGTRRAVVGIARRRRAQLATVLLVRVVLGGLLVGFFGEGRRDGGPGFDGMRGRQGAATDITDITDTAERQRGHHG